MADIKEAIRRLIFQYISEGADEVIKQQEAVAATTTKTDKASLSLEKAFTNLESRYDSTLKYQREYQKTQDKVNAAVAQNPALQERANSLLANAAEHYDKLAFAANKGGIASSFLSKAISSILGPAGLMGAAMTAIGVAVGYMASQFQSASTTIEQALEEQNRLLKEAKTLIDAKASAEQKAFAQSKELTQFQLERSERDLSAKIRAAQDAAAIAARGRSTRPTQVGGEMGEAPTGVASLGPGYEQIADAVEKLNAAMAAGQPGLAAFQEELAKVGRAHPEIAQTAEEMIKLAQQGIPLEHAQLKLRAISDALKGIATDAQLAAVGLGSIAQFTLSNLQATEAAEATERMAQATLKIAAAYPGMSVEVAKQLYALQGQLTVAQARTGAEQIVAQEYVTQNNLLAQGKTLEEAIAIAAAQREIAEANVSKAINDQIHSLEQQVELSKARMNGTEAAVIAEQAYVNALRQGANELDAQNLKAAVLRNEQQKITEKVEGSTRAMQSFGAAIQRATVWSLSLGDAIENSLSYFDTGQFKPGGYSIDYDPHFTALKKKSIESRGGTADPIMFNGAIVGYRQKFDEVNTSLSDLAKSNDDLTKSTDSLNETMQNALSPFYSQDPRTTKLGFRAGVTGNPDWMTGATNANPLVAVLGAGATAPGMAGGGSFTVGGGYSANDNRMAVFPVASGEEVVVNRNPQGRGGQVVNIDNRIIIQGAVDDDALSKMKVSRYQQAQRMRAGLA